MSIQHDLARRRQRWPLLGLRVLLVDDDEDTLSLTGLCLERAGARVLSAERVDSALERVAEVGSIDVIVSDVCLPGGNGADLIRSLQALGHTAPAVALTGFSAFALNCSPFHACVVKPVNIGQLVRLLAELCHRSNPRPETCLVGN